MSKKETILPCWFFGLLIAIVIFWGLWHFIDFENKFDSLSSLFSGLAFAGLIGTLVYQKQELALQRQELEDTRSVLKDTAQANITSAELAKRNLRAQYLFFWLKQNKNKYHNADDNAWKSSNLLSQLAIKYKIHTLEDFNNTDPTTINLQDKHRQEFPLSSDPNATAILRDALKSQDFCQYYKRRQQELDMLTAPEGAEAPPELSKDQPTNS